MKKKVIVWGTGKAYEMQKRFIEDEFQILGYIDKKKAGIIKVEDILKYEFDYIYISTIKYESEIREELRNVGINDEKILTKRDMHWPAVSDMDGFSLLYRWIRLAQSGITIEKLFLDRNIRKLALYGFDRIASCILYELKQSSVQVQAIIDKKGDEIFIDYMACKPNEIGKLEVDAIIMMPVGEYRDIKSQLCQYTQTDIISIEEILYEL